jgi:hypothetical protein
LQCVSIVDVDIEIVQTAFTKSSCSVGSF